MSMLHDVILSCLARATKFRVRLEAGRGQEAPWLKTVQQYIDAWASAFRYADQDPIASLALFRSLPPRSITR